jgi:integrase
LKVRGKPFWRLLEPGLHLGYRRLAGRPGSWCVRKYVGSQTYAVETIGAVADDYSEANGDDVLDFRQAQRRALDHKPRAAAGALTVRGALDLYLADLAHRGKPTQDAKYRIDALIAPALGAVAVEALSTEQIRAWHAGLAKAPARHGRNGDDGEAQRRRRSSANRTLTILRSALNLAYREGRVPSDGAWRRVRPFQGVDAARVRYLSVAECRRLINACGDTDFGRLVAAALQSGMRYGELARLHARDFNADSGTVTVRQSKSGKPRHVMLTDEGAALFARWAAGKAGNALLLTRDGEPWGKSQQDLRMKEACERAKIEPPVNFHQLRHTWASLSVMAGMPLMIVARNLGHRDTRMCEVHYAHLAPGHVREAIRASAPRFGIEPDGAVVPLKAVRP